MSLGGGHSAEGSNAGGIFVQFNQDCTSLVAGSSDGYHLFALTPDDGVEEVYASRSGQDTCLVDRLFSSSLVAIVTVAAPRSVSLQLTRPQVTPARARRLAPAGAGPRDSPIGCHIRRGLNVVARVCGDPRPRRPTQRAYLRCE